MLSVVQRYRRRGEDGQDLAEYALILPILLLVILGILELAVIIFSYNTISNAAREGARVGVISGATDEQIRAAAINRALALELTEANVLVEHPTETTVRVDIQYDSHLITGALLSVLGGNDTVRLRAAATMRKER